MREISIVIPVYNEEQVIKETYRRLKEVMDAEGGYELIFVNDGSRDKSEELLREIAAQDKNVRLINFARNFGHQKAITAGMDMAAGNAVIVIDADLQDPPEVMSEMIKKWRQGFEVVYGKRIRREGEGFFKKFLASVFYRLLKAVTNIDIPVDTGDFRLIDRSVCDILKTMREDGRYIRGMVSFAGFRQASVEYIRKERFAGETKYSARKMARLALDGITSFSSAPLKLAGLAGTLLFVGALIYFIVMLCCGKGVQSLGMTVLLVADAVILWCIGVLGEYVGRIYEQSKGRPLYIIKDKVGFDENADN